MPRIVDSEQRRGQILAGLWAVVHEHGVEGVTLGRVAVAAGVSIGRIQHYFASRDELVLAGCRGILELAERVHEERTAGLDPETSLLALLCQPIPGGDEAFRLGAAVWSAYLARAAVDERIGRIVREAERGTRARIASLLAALGAAPGEADRLAAFGAGLAQRALLGCIEPAQAERLLGEELRRLRPRPSGDGRGAAPSGRPGPQGAAGAGA